MGITQLLTGKSGNASEAKKFKVEFRLDKLVRWLSVYQVAAIAFFLTTVQEFFKGSSGSISCLPLSMTNNTQPYDATKAEYDQTYCLENMVDYSLVLTNHLPPTDLYQRYFPYVLGVQAGISAAPLVLWKLCGSDMLEKAGNYVAGKMTTVPNEKEVKTVEEAGDDVVKPKEKVAAVSPELKKQISSWWKQTWLTKLYICHLLCKLLIFILVIYFYLGWDAFFIQSMKYNFLCYVDEKDFVKCSLAGVGVLRLAWFGNLILVGLVLLLTTFQLMYILCCANKPKKEFLYDWNSIAGEKTDSRSCKIFLNDAHLIAMICRENKSNIQSPTPTQ